ncbi:homeobox protein DLX-2 isoform X1 [Equus przewalskii]|uniref:Homeobox protein DLX-2 isoform X1 n=1 Tax=Equus przewalskii TaxID=9798 RepID=A0ABM4LB20_EQUPR
MGARCMPHGKPHFLATCFFFLSSMRLSSPFLEGPVPRFGGGAGLRVAKLRLSSAQRFQEPASRLRPSPTPGTPGGREPLGSAGYAVLTIAFRCRERGPRARNSDSEREAKESPETPHHLLQLPAGGSSAAFPKDSVPGAARASRAGGVSGPHPDSGQDLVPESPIQVQEDVEKRGDTLGAAPWCQRLAALRFAACLGAGLLGLRRAAADGGWRRPRQRRQRRRQLRLQPEQRGLGFPGQLPLVPPGLGLRLAPAGRGAAAAPDADPAAAPPPPPPPRRRGRPGERGDDFLTTGRLRQRLREQRPVILSARPRSWRVSPTGPLTPPTPPRGCSGGMACPWPCSLARPPSCRELEGVCSPPGLLSKESGSGIGRATGHGRLSDLSPASDLPPPARPALRGRPAPSPPRAAS